MKSLYYKQKTINAVVNSFIDANLSQGNHDYDHWDWLRQTATDIYDSAAYDGKYLSEVELTNALDKKMHGEG